jgi:hypothetical protein
MRRRLPDIEGVCRRRFPDVFTPAFQGVVPCHLFALRPGARPPRHDALPGRYRAAGYLAGELLTGDYGANDLEARGRIERDPPSAAFVRMAWTAVLLPAGASGDEIFTATHTARGKVRQTAWGNDRNEYKVRLDDPALLVENELYFPGWTATLSAHETPVEAERIRGAFRGWRLPPGRYRMTTRFRMRRLNALFLVSAISATAYATLWGVAGLRRKQRRGNGRRWSSARPNDALRH